MSNLYETTEKIGKKLLQIYSDSTFTKKIETVEWNNEQIIKLVTGKQITLENTAKAGELAKAEVYIRNEGKYLCFITKIILSESRLSFKISRAELKPNEFAVLTISFKVPENITPADVIKAGEIKIEGYYIYTED